MLLQQLKLKNIRSYLDETITLSEGSTLLSGDIGSGKSTLLLAIEFALFGISRPDLPGEALLRKGCSQGSVELQFKINDNSILITRNLKKEKDSVKQTSGFMVINNTRKDLTPVELKAEIIALLGYPEEFLTKNKNYIFRYTIYTPQEEMKLILQDDAEIRLDVLRKIFNIDKYKNIRDNLEVYLKLMRMELAILETKTERFEEEKTKLEVLQKEKERLDLNLKELSPEKLKLEREILQRKDELDLIEKEQQKFLELKQYYKTILALIKEKNSQKEHLSKRKEELEEQINRLLLPEELNLELVTKKISELEKNKNDLFTKKVSLQGRLGQLQESLKELHAEIKEIERSVLSKAEKEESKKQLSLEIADKEKLKQKQLQLEELLDRTVQIIIRNQILLNQSHELKETIAQLQSCPTCLQDVSERHKHKIQEQEEEKIDTAQRLLQESGLKKEEIWGQKETVKNRIERLQESEQQLTKIKLELIIIEEKKESIHKKKEQLNQWLTENNQLVQQLEELEKKSSLEQLNLKLKEARGFLESFSKKLYLEQAKLETEKQIVQNRELLGKLEQELVLLEEKLAPKNDFSLRLTELKLQLNLLLEREKAFSIKMAQLQTGWEGALKQEQVQEKVLEEQNKFKNKLIRWKELYHWLDQYFSPLTETIEKQVMLNIHHLFNLLFQEWFSILIDDENIYSRLDDSFTPIIEQNGYEISFNNLSGGEKTSAALAYRLSLNKVINQVIQEIRTKDLLILDEPTDGFSSEQLDKVREVLDKLGLKQTIIVSHESKIESFVERVIRVNKEGHVSKVTA